MSEFEEEEEDEVEEEEEERERESCCIKIIVVILQKAQVAAVVSSPEEDPDDIVDMKELAEDSPMFRQKIKILETVKTVVTRSRAREEQRRDLD